jgi:hypothetical protein
LLVEEDADPVTTPWPPMRSPRKVKRRPKRRRRHRRELLLRVKSAARRMRRRATWTRRLKDETGKKE